MGLPETVTLTNRSSKTLNAIFDGQTFVLKPGDNHGFPSVAVQYAKDQNPLMGSQDRYDFYGNKFLVGVKAWGDPVTPLEQSDAIERLDRETIEDEGRTAVPGPKVRVRRSEVTVGLPTDGEQAAAR